jgi:AcrR family transcriptional regulator
VPKRADHGERRRQIADALLRTAATRGLHATGMREVAAEAGVSLRLVQYYFGTKEDLLLAAMQYLAARFGARAVARFKEASRSGGPASPRGVITAILAEALPTDDDRRTFYVVYTAYLALSLTDPALAIAPLVKNSDMVIDVVAVQLRAAQAAGDTPARLDPDLEAFSLMAMSAGLATSVLAGQSSIRQAQAVIDYNMDRLFPASRPALQLRRGHAELGQEAAVVGLHSLLGQSPVVVVPEGVDHFPFDVLAGGLDWSDGRGCEHAGEVAIKRVPRGQEPAVSDDLLTDDSQVAEGGARRGEVSAELVEAQVAAGPVEDVILPEVVRNLTSSSRAITSSPMRVRPRASGLSGMKPGTVPSSLLV